MYAFSMLLLMEFERYCGDYTLVLNPEFHLQILLSLCQYKIYRPDL